MDLPTRDMTLVYDLRVKSGRNRNKQYHVVPGIPRLDGEVTLRLDVCRQLDRSVMAWVSTNSGNYATLTIDDVSYTVFVDTPNPVAQGSSPGTKYTVVLRFSDMIGAIVDGLATQNYIQLATQDWIGLLA